MITQIKSDNSYGDLIIKYLNREFPQVIQMKCNDKIDFITDIMVGTKEVRYGSIPSPESLVVIRKVIRQAMAEDKPIPVLVPWGSLKGDFSDNIDIAEVSGVNRLIQLNKAVQQVHPKGLDVVIRVEDTSGILLFGFDMDTEEVKERVNSYSSKFEELVDILNPDKSIGVVRESRMYNTSFFGKEVEDAFQYFERYLLESDEIADQPEKLVELTSYKKLQELGWKGTIPLEQREHYFNTYRRLYPTEPHYRAVERLALYMCESYARHKLGMTGKKSSWDSYIQVTFVQPIKGLPEGYHDNCVYYRTLPMSQARTHICPWRGKGYLLMTGNSVCAKMASFGNTEIMEQLIESETILTDGTREVTIKTDFIIS